jgi:diaminopimelate epimerase
MRVVKAHAYGNDFLLMEESELPAGIDRPGLARRMCDRHRGIGADGLMIYSEPPDPRTTEPRASMRLLNADGSRSEVSGNGVRCLAVMLAAGHPEAEAVVVETEAGDKRLDLIARDGARVTFRASMGAPTELRTQTLEVLGQTLDVVTMRVGNPQCVVLGPLSPDGDARLHTVARALATHPAFPEGTNVELADVERPDLVRILIWERGVGPTWSSGTGACAAAVAAAAYGGAARDVTIAAPGGDQRVEWTDDGIFLTGWAELTLDGTWLAR